MIAIVYWNVTKCVTQWISELQRALLLILIVKVTIYFGYNHKEKIQYIIHTYNILVH